VEVGDGFLVFLFYHCIGLMGVAVEFSGGAFSSFPGLFFVVFVFSICWHWVSPAGELLFFATEHYCPE
jgi:hypothetical protein